MVVNVTEMALFVLIGVLRGFPAAAYRRRPRRKSLCGLDQNKNCSFLHWTLFKGFEIEDRALWAGGSILTKNPSFRSGTK